MKFNIFSRKKEESMQRRAEESRETVEEVEKKVAEKAARLNDLIDQITKKKRA